MRKRKCRARVEIRKHLTYLFCDSESCGMKSNTAVNDWKHLHPLKLTIFHAWKLVAQQLCCRCRNKTNLNRHVKLNLTFSHYYCCHKEFKIPCYSVNCATLTIWVLWAVHTRDAEVEARIKKTSGHKHSLKKGICSFFLRQCLRPFVFFILASTPASLVRTDLLSPRHFTVPLVITSRNPHPVYGGLFWKQRSWHTLIERASCEAIVSSKTIHESEGTVLLMWCFSLFVSKSSLLVILVIRTLANSSGFYRNKCKHYLQEKSQRRRDGRGGSSCYCRVNNTLRFKINGERRLFFS